MMSHREQAGIVLIVFTHAATVTIHTLFSERGNEMLDFIVGVGQIIKAFFKSIFPSKKLELSGGLDAWNNLIPPDSWEKMMPPEKEKYSSVYPMADLIGSKLERIHTKPATVPGYKEIKLCFNNGCCLTLNCSPMQYLAGRKEVSILTIRSNWAMIRAEADVKHVETKGKDLTETEQKEYMDGVEEWMNAPLGTPKVGIEHKEELSLGFMTGHPDEPDR